MTLLEMLIAGEELEKKKRWEEKMKSRMGTVTDSHLFLVPVPKRLWGKSYRELFRDFVESNDMLPLGLKRGMSEKLKVGPNGNRMPYVFTNCTPDTITFKEDSVFVLSPKEPENSGKEAAQKKTKEEAADHFRSSVQDVCEMVGNEWKVDRSSPTEIQVKANEKSSESKDKIMTIPSHKKTFSSPFQRSRKIQSVHAPIDENESQIDVEDTLEPTRHTVRRRFTFKKTKVTADDESDRSFRDSDQRTQELNETTRKGLADLDDLFTSSFAALTSEIQRLQAKVKSLEMEAASRNEESVALNGHAAQASINLESISSSYASPEGENEILHT